MVRRSLRTMDRLLDIKRFASKLADRHIWAVDLMILAVLAAFLAAGVDSFLATRATLLLNEALLPASGDMPKAVSARRPRVIEPFRPVTGDDILGRNLFDSVTGPLLGQEIVLDPETQEEQEQVETPEFTPRCELPLSLQASYASPDHPEYSFISVRNGADSEILELGDTILDHQVSYITWQYAFLTDAQGLYCYLDLWAEDGPGKHAPGKRQKGQKGKKGKKGKNSKAKLLSLLNKSIQKLSPTHRVLDPELASFLSQNDQMIVADVRVLPNMVKGTASGVKLYGIRKNSVLGHLGFRNGDVLLSSNGAKVAGPQQIKNTFSSLGGTGVEVQVQRKGKVMTMRYEVK